MDEVNRSLRRKEEVDGEGCSSANPFNIRPELTTINQRGQQRALFSSLAALSVRTVIAPWCFSGQLKAWSRLTL
jgi:hypothetical protein